ncbi:LacI family DNA-binding transcriptional regulator [Arthrobacter ulcerisalmonis]|nr:LacI family DNA-binding transcriptional regulator [Arthrobacter ulcerisalmonis]
MSTPRLPNQRATIMDVAAAAGVSRQTVTRAMNDMTGISAVTRERVQSVAIKLGYTPSRFAKGLVQGASVSVGLAIPDLTNPYFPAFASSVVEAATELNWTVVVDDYGHGTASALDAVERLAPQVDAIIGYLGSDADKAQEIMGRRPVLALDVPESGAAGSISFDYDHAARLALEHVAGMGRTRVGFLDASGEGHAASRGSAIARAAVSLGIELTLCTAEASAAAAREVVRALLAESYRPDALLVFNDLMAAGALKAFEDRGVDVPRDCVVVGMDGIPLGELTSPELTTLSLDLRLVGRTAVGLLAGLLAGDVQAGAAGSAVILRHDLVVRQSA